MISDIGCITLLRDYLIATLLQRNDTQLCNESFVIIVISVEGLLSAHIIFYFVYLAYLCLYCRVAVEVHTARGA